MTTTVIKSIKANGTGDYTTLAAWVADRKGNLVTRDTIEIAEIYGGGNVGEVLLHQDDWTVDADRYIWIRAAADNEHPGIFDSSKAYMKGVTTHLTAQIHVPYTKFGPGISIYNNLVDPLIGEPTHAVIVANIDSGGPVIVDGIVAKVATGIAFRVEYCDSSITHIFKNCVSTFGSNSITCARATNAKMAIYNSTLIAGGVGIGLEADNDGGIFGPPAAPGILVSENNYISAETAYLILGVGSSLTQGSKDATSTSEATDPALRGISYTSAGFYNAFTPEGGEGRIYEDLHLTSSSVLIGKGTDIASVTTDIDGKTRPSGAYDIGADQYAAPTTITKTVKTSGGDYTNLNLWEAGRRGNLARRNTLEIVEVYNGVTTTDFVMIAKNWGANLKNYPIIRAATGQGHAGIFDTSKVYIKNDTSTQSAFYCSVGATRIGPGLCVEHSFYSGEDPHGIHIEDIFRAGPIVIQGCIIKCAPLKDNDHSIISVNSAYDSALPHTIRNCQSWTAGGATASRGYHLHGNEWRCYNNTIYSFGSFAEGITSNGGTVISQNNYISSTACYATQGGGTTTKGSNDATSTSEALNASLRNLAPTSGIFVDGIPVGYPDTAPDVHIVLTSALKDAGTDLSNLSPSYLSVTVDFEGDPRQTDIGADEFPDSPICWNFTAKYRNSSKLYKVSGPGSFPRRLRIPGNVDISTGRLIDDGTEIGPDRFDIESI
jgi:hypothetical protein